MLGTLIKLFYDSQCPVCSFEVAELEARDQHHQVLFIDIHSETFQVMNCSKSIETLSEEIHVQLTSGEWLKGLDALGLVYEKVGLGWLASPLKCPVSAAVAHRFYRVFAKNRQGIGRYTGWLLTRLKARRTRKRMQSCKNGVCELPPTRPPR